MPPLSGPFGPFWGRGQKGLSARNRAHKEKSRLSQTYMNDSFIKPRLYGYVRGESCLSNSPRCTRPVTFACGCKSHQKSRPGYPRDPIRLLVGISTDEIPPCPQSLEWYHQYYFIRGTAVPLNNPRRGRVSLPGRGVVLSPASVGRQAESGPSDYLSQRNFGKTRLFSFSFSRYRRCGHIP